MIMWPFKNNNVKNGKWIGRKCDFNDKFWFKLDIKIGISVSDLSALLNNVNGFTYFDKEFLGGLPGDLNKHFRKMTLEEFDAIYNPDMEYDQGNNPNAPCYKRTEVTG